MARKSPSIAIIGAGQARRKYAVVIEQGERNLPALFPGLPGCVTTANPLCIGGFGKASPNGGGWMYNR